MRQVVVVQARMGSSRLPGKVMLPLGGRTALAQCLDRCAAIPGIAQVVCAVPVGAQDDPVAAEAERVGAAVFRGDEKDVLSRYLGAARMAGADIVMRVTSDCPLVDPAICGQVLALRAAERADYAANNMPASFPHGLDCEAFTRDALEQAAATATLPAEREHVTPWIRTNPALRRVNLANPRGDQSAIRVTLDHPEDYAMLAALFDALAPGGRSGLDALLAAVARDPTLLEINARHAVHRPAPAATP